MLLSPQQSINKCIFSSFQSLTKVLSAVLNLHPTEQPVWDCPANWRLNTVGYSIVSRIILLDTTRFESLIIICPVNSVSARSKSFRWLHWYLLLTTSGSCWDQGGFSLSPCLVIGTWLYLLHWGNLTLLWRRYWSLCTVWHSRLFLLWSSGFPHLQVNPLNKGVVMHYRVQNKIRAFSLNL